MAALKYWVWLTALPGLSNRSRLLLLERYGSPEDVYYADAEELALTEGLTPGQAQLLSDKSLTRADRILADCARGDIFLLTMQDAAYPARLRDIFDPPVLLYGKGSLPLFDEEAAIAVVGTRSCTPYGLRCAHRMGYELARQGAVVVSGMAKGIDGAAMRGALQAGGFTAAVLGGVKAGRGVTVGADGTLEVTRENLNAVLGFSLTEKLERLERMMNMDGKLVYTGAGVAGKSATSLTVPGTVNYIVVRMVAPTAENDANPVAAAADYGSTRIVRGGTAVAMVGGTSSDLSNGVKCSGAAPVRMNFADSGVLSIGVVRTDTSLSFEYPFNVEGYQYV